MLVASYGLCSPCKCMQWDGKDLKMAREMEEFAKDLLPMKV